MRFSTLAAAAMHRYPGSGQRHGRSDPDIGDVTHDSREVTAGSLFVCIPGVSADGHDFASAAVESGAAALVVERHLALDVPQLIVDESRHAMAYLAAAVHGWPTDTLSVVGVTGTNGKTSVIHLLRSIFVAHGESVEVIGTLTGARTTPESSELQRLFARAETAGVDRVAMEVSSHALVQRRVAATRFAATAFTNLSPEHLDYHGTMEEYFHAKALLFDPSYSDLAVIDIDTPHGRLLADATDQAVVVRVSVDDVEVTRLAATSLAFRWRGRLVEMGLGGRFNVANALVAAETAAALGVDDETVVAGLAAAPAVPGRFEAIDEGQPFGVIVDYAHTPDALRSLLESARQIVAAGRRVTVVFGCGGDRDREKRPKMGRVAADLADRTILTSDNARREDPAAIVADIIGGMANRRPVIELDREVAIERAVSEAEPGDIVVIAGKGHESTQIMGDDVRPFDDRAVARDVLTRGRPL